MAQSDQLAENSLGVISNVARYGYSGGAYVRVGGVQIEPCIERVDGTGSASANGLHFLRRAIHERGRISAYPGAARWRHCELIEQTIGWELSAGLLVLFGLWAAVYAIASLWKALNPVADVIAYEDRLEFHPAVRRAAASYDEISHWSIKASDGHPVVWLHFFEPYWSLQGLFERKPVKLEGGKEDVEPLVQFFARDPVMREKYAG
ncbi:hypothetical protein [uncultured Sphingomonas sp.]|uniref:hypothetical protein n=1 Tax=uncultured Sphingomonas sp. TaxID=158754 RepID=UPI0025F4FB20|nr:hypothetical protein [uncultured Sphingomonas sp.]